MQVKPAFENFKILEQYSILSDDTNNEMCLTLFEVKLKDPHSQIIIESTYKMWTVVGKKQEQWGNKAISYSDAAFWRSSNKNRKLYSGIINNIKIVEKLDGNHHLFVTKYPIQENEVGIRTKFEISRTT